MATTAPAAAPAALTLHDLERAASDVIRLIKQVPEARGDTKLALIGGLALWHYLPEGRTTDNINFITNISTSPGTLKKRLLRLPGSPFVQRAQVLFYIVPDTGREIRVDILPEWLAPYLPSAAKRVRDLPDDAAAAGKLPYVSRADLVILKLDASGLRSDVALKKRDAADAASLVGRGASWFPLWLPPLKREVAREALVDVDSAWRRAWWEDRLGLGFTRFYSANDASFPSASSSSGPSSSGPSSAGPTSDVDGDAEMTTYYHVEDADEDFEMIEVEESPTSAVVADADADHEQPNSGFNLEPYADAYAYARCALSFAGGVSDASNPWFYERLDAAQVVRRRESRSRSLGPSGLPPRQENGIHRQGKRNASGNIKKSAGNSSGNSNSSSGVSSRDQSRSCSLNPQPRTTHAAFAARRTLESSGYGSDNDCDDEYYYIEPTGSARSPVPGREGGSDATAVPGGLRLLAGGRKRSVTFLV